MDVSREMELQGSRFVLLRRQVLLVVALVALSGCATFRDIQQDMSQWNLRSKKDPWKKAPDDGLDEFGERRPSRIIARDFQLRNFATTMRVITATGQNTTTAQRDFDQGRELYDKACALHEAGSPENAATIFHQAANKFREAAARLPDSALEEDSLFLQGEGFFFANQYVLANRAYEGLIARYSGSSYLDQAEARRFAIAQYWLKASEKTPPVLGIQWANSTLPTVGAASEARRILHRIRLDDPTGRLADDATMALGAAHFRAGNYQDAADAFGDLRKSYAGSPHQFNAHLFELKALMATYAGPDYDGAPLEKADKLMQTMVQQFPNEVGQNKEYLASEGNRIRNMLADRDFKVGQFYEGKGENRAAGLYYNEVAERFKDTSVSEQATERIAAIADEPEKPVRVAGFLEDIFPDPRASKPIVPTITR